MATPKDPSSHAKVTRLKTSGPRVTALDIPREAPMSAETEKYFRICEEKLGLVPNVLRAYAFDDVKLRAFTDLYNDLMLGDSNLTKLEREMIAVVVSSVNRCFYCLVAHGAAVREISGDPKLGELMVMNYRAADLDERTRAMLDFAVTLTESPETIEEEDREMLREVGFLRPRHLGHRQRRRLLQHVEPGGGGLGHAAERGVSREGAIAAWCLVPGAWNGGRCSVHGNRENARCRS